MNTALQVALLAACVAVVFLVVCLVPLGFLIWRRLERLTQIVEELRTSAQMMVHDGRELMWQATELSRRATRQMDDVDRIVCTARQWTERADRIANAVGSMVEPPVFALAEGTKLARVGMTAFLKSLFHGGQRLETEQERNQTREKDHV